MQYVEIKLTAGEYADLERAAQKKGMSIDSFIQWATLHIYDELSQRKQDTLPTAAPAYAPPAYQMPYPARPGASGEAGEVDR